MSQPETQIQQPGAGRELLLVCASASRARAQTLSAALATDEIAPHIWSPEEGAQADLSRAFAVAVCWTPAACGSDAVMLQAVNARGAGKLVEVLLAPCRPPSPFGRRFGTADLADWGGDRDDPAVRALVEIVRARAEGRSTRPHVLGMRLVRWGGVGVAAAAALTFAVNLGSLKQTWDSFLNPAASEKALAATDAKVDAVLTMLKTNAGQTAGSSPPAGSETALRQTIADLLSAQDGARGRAADRLASGDAAGALEELQQAAAEAEKANAGLSETWKEIGALAFYAETDTAVAAYERALALAPQDHNARLQLAQLYGRVGRQVEAEQALFQVIGASAEAQDRKWLAEGYHLLGLHYRVVSQPEQEEQTLLQALTLHTELGDVVGQRNDLAELSITAGAAGDAAASREYLARSVALRDKAAGDPALDYADRAELARLKGDWRKARELYSKGLEVSEKSGNLVYQINFNSSLGRIELDRGKIDKAEARYQRALALARQIRDLEGEAISLSDLSILEERRKRMPAAIDYGRQSADAYQNAGMLADADAMMLWVESVEQDIGQAAPANR